MTKNSEPTRKALRSKVNELTLLLGTVASANAYAAELMAELEETRQELEERNRELEAQKNALMQALQKAESADAANEAKSRFLANVSHEMRTPLQHILGLGDLLLEGELTGEQRPFCLNIRSSADTLHNLINQLLDLSKIEAGHLILERIEFDPASVIADSVQLVTQRAREKGLDIAVHGVSGLPECAVGDPERFRQILVNLLSNAVKFTERGGIRLAAEVESQFENGAVLRIAVSDTGIGIPASYHGSLFAPFSQADTSTTRKFGGTGLGLAIARNLAECMGGKMGLDSQEGRGSTFWFTLKVGSAPHRRQAEEAMPARTAGDRETPLTGRVLLAEDNAVNQMIVLRMLKKLGLAADLAATGREAVDAASLGSYDLILMDCQMPEMDGYEATRLLRGREQGRFRIPVVAVTAHAMSGDREKCLAAGMDDYITKPIQFEVLRGIAQKWCGRRDSV
jgi:signal transduction histidine kinase/ActR/RegA family two-component response regulator